MPVARCPTNLFLLDEANESGPFDFHSVPVLVEQCNDEMEKITFPQIRWRLFLEMGSSQADTV